MTPTLNSNLSSAELCRRNGWTVGTLLAGSEYGTEAVILITAVGEDHIYARQISRDRSEPVKSREAGWSLMCREWREVK